MGFLARTLQACAIIIAVFALLIGLLISGVMSQMGVFALLDLHETARGRRFMGMLPAMHVGTPWGFTEEQMPNLNGQTFVVTGGNVGLGYWTAFHLARAGASSVVIACRDIRKCKIAAENLTEAVGSKAKLGVIPMVLDLSSFRSIIAFADDFRKRFNQVDGLVLNAGVMMPPFSKTQDGLELQIGTNHFGHHLLTQELLPLVEEAAKRNKGATVVAVSSSAHYASYDEGILPNIEAMNDETKYDRRKAYGQSKLANVLFAQELSRRVAGTGVLVNSIHPGGVDTELFRHIFDLIETKVGISIEFLKGKGTWHPRDAALTQDYAAIAPQVKIGGRYLHPIARENKPDPHAQNEALQKHLWDTTEEFISNWKAINKS